MAVFAAFRDAVVAGAFDLNQIIFPVEVVSVGKRKIEHHFFAAPISGRIFRGGGAGQRQPFRGNRDRFANLNIFDFECAGNILQPDHQFKIVLDIRRNIQNITVRAPRRSSGLNRNIPHGRVFITGLPERRLQFGGFPEIFAFRHIFLFHIGTDQDRFSGNDVFRNAFRNAVATPGAIENKDVFAGFRILLQSGLGGIGIFGQVYGIKSAVLFLRYGLNGLICRMCGKIKSETAPEKNR